MMKRSRKLVVWSPRILAILVCIFVSLFALDALGNGTTLRGALPDVAIHLAPALLLVALLVASWRWAWVGGFGFTAAAAGYAYVARNHVSWILCISVPLLILGALFIWSWLHQREPAAST